jgi:hypothetical protein
VGEAMAMAAKRVVKTRVSFILKMLRLECGRIVE